jgi:hypothetical protein
MAILKIRELRRKLVRAGAIKLRSNRHEIWLLPRGTKIGISLGSGDLTQNVLSTVRQAFKQDGILVDF